MKILTIYKRENKLSISISDLITKEDYDLWWKGVEPEGSEGVESETISKIRAICDNYVVEGSYTDIQIWEEGNAIVDNLDLLTLDELKAALEVEFGELEIWEG